MARKYTDDALRNHLRELADVLGRPPTTTDMDERGPCSANTYKRRFGSWNAALRASGLSVNRERDVDEVDLLQEIARLAGELGRPPILEEMQEEGRFGATVYRDRFGSWGKALAAAGYRTRGTEPRRSQNVDYLREHGPATVDDLPGGELQVTDRMLGAATFRLTTRGSGRTGSTTPKAVYYLIGEHEKRRVVERFFLANPTLLADRTDQQLVGLVGRQGQSWKEPARSALADVRGE